MPAYTNATANTWIDTDKRIHARGHTFQHRWRSGLARSRSVCTHTHTLARRARASMYVYFYWLWQIHASVFSHRHAYTHVHGGHMYAAICDCVRMSLNIIYMIKRQTKIVYTHSQSRRREFNFFFLLHFFVFVVVLFFALHSCVIFHSKISQYHSIRVVLLLDFVLKLLQFHISRISWIIWLFLKCKQYNI